ncbi:MAG: hypothetical protein AB7T49_12055 [Oligoflexales bacterium]
MRIFGFLKRCLPVVGLAFVVQCDGIHNPGESKDQSAKQGSGDVETGSCDISDTACQEQIQSHLAALQVKIEPLVSDKTCTAQSECKAVSSYGYCPTTIAISTRATVEKDLTVLVSDYQNTLLRLPQPQDCETEESQTAQCVSRQCSLTPTIDVIGENIAMLARKLDKVILINDQAVTFVADGKIVYSDEASARESDNMSSALRGLASESACELHSLETKTSPVTKAVTESEVADVLSCLGTARFEVK